MQTFYEAHEFPVLPFAVVSSGTFDGVHIGHQSILKKVVETARLHNGQSVIVTFFPHPRMFFGQEVKLLNTLQERIELIAQTGVDYLLVLKFNEHLANFSANEFVEKIYIQTTHAKKLILGYDHHFGKNRSGNIDFLKANLSRYSFDLEEIPAQDIDQITISSTKIRSALFSKDISTATKYLGRYYTLSGKVIEGDKIGRTIGYPTANLQMTENYKLIPAEGIYAVWVKIDNQRYGGMLYIGKRPVIDKNSELRIEVNIFDFDQDIYGKTITLEFVNFLRNDMNFESLEALQAQLSQDKLAALVALQKKSL
ncbi:bifunctional riboflavin kinase/FAD synthetase [Raineya orbicola]|uniref:Riboflavin biosynthesis protein n=1 Tax=Raineya orbicola TaxID=2016530 RepID=A0A2N3II78_9BACT|nr:bifunctional riboflavin kinase/FAD synthetase [Raineya orbicola]PKQ70017.1 ribF: riboflavin biosynthesis protein RibF [Raineya orbicola]